MTPSPDPGILADLNEFLGVLENDPDTREGLMRERIEAARAYLMLAMTEEYQAALKLAERALPDVPDETLRDRIARFLKSQLRTK